MIIRKTILALMLFTFLGLGTWAVFSDKEKVVYVDTAQVSVQTLYTTLSVNGTIMDTGLQPSLCRKREEYQSCL